MRPRSMEGVDLRALDIVSDYDDHLMCPICHCPFIKPVRLQCDHVFCQTCLNTAINSGDMSTEDFTCPTCRSSAMAIFMNVPRLLINMCDDVRVKCPFSGQGCTEILPRGHVQSHVDRYCDSRLFTCPDDTCTEKTRKRDLDPDGRCMHGLHLCEGCQEYIMEQDMNTHAEELCPSLKSTCPDCNESVHHSALREHIDSCPDAIRQCTASKYGCPVKLKQSEISGHEGSCPLVTLGPYLEAQSSRIDSMDTTIKQLRQRNEILEDGIASIRTTLTQTSRLPPESEPDSSPSANPIDISRVSYTAPSIRASTHADNASTRTDNASNLSSSTATTYLLSLHESLREEVIQLSGAITDLDARASMAIMSESLRIKEDMAHTNATLNSVRMQVHWLMNPRLHQGQRATTVGANHSGSTGGTLSPPTPNPARRNTGIDTPEAGPSNPGLSSSSSPTSGLVGGRRLSDSVREGTKL
ncbi:hypothetical protein FQN54_003264 [Arachnomyces sp. PD_36]|nr:hypothetical protein FQN54_003264 [Arachnomyces sp. PD_36]